MAVYIVQGKLGTGKGKYAVTKMRKALAEGRRVATNFDLWLENLLPASSLANAVRVPDKPTAADLDAAGPGNPDRYDETKNGILVLDELGSWFNARSFQDKGRAALIDWLIHSRKKGWDCYLIVQSLDMVDKQLRVALAEYLVKCIRADKIKIPVIGHLMGKRGTLPRMHIAQTSLADVPGVTIDREIYRGDDIQQGYDTLQIFRDWIRDPADPSFHGEMYMGPFSYLSPWHIKGRFMSPVKKTSLLSRVFTPKPRLALKPKAAPIEALKRLPPAVAWLQARELVMAGAV